MIPHNVEHKICHHVYQHKEQKFSYFVVFDGRIGIDPLQPKIQCLKCLYIELLLVRIEMLED